MDQPSYHNPSNRVHYEYTRVGTRLRIKSSRCCKPSFAKIVFCTYLSSKVKHCAILVNICQLNILFAFKSVLLFSYNLISTDLSGWKIKWGESGRTFYTFLCLKKKSADFERRVISFHSPPNSQSVPLLPKPSQSFLTHTVILPDWTLKKWGPYNFAF